MKDYNLVNKSEILFLFLLSFFFAFNFIFCNLPSYPSPQTEVGIVVSSEDGGVYIKNGVVYETVGRKVKVGLDIIHTHRVDSMFFSLEKVGGRTILKKGFYKKNGDIVISDSTKKRMYWDTTIILTCVGDYEVKVIAYLDNEWIKEKNQIINIGGSGINLDSLKVEGCELTPSFRSNVYKYRGVVENEVSTLKITPYLMGDCIQLTINGDTISSESEKECVLEVGKNLIEIKSIVSGVYERRYEIEVNRRERKDETRLLTLEIKGITLTPLFNSDIDSGYYAEIGAKVDSIKMVAISRNERAKIIIEKDSGIGELGISRSLKYGENKIVVKVISEDGNRIKEYKITLVKKGSSESRLKDLKIYWLTMTPAFNPDSMRYKAYFSENDTQVLIKVKSLDSNSIVIIGRDTVTEKIFKILDRDSVKVKVISENKVSISEYVIYFEKIRSNNADLGEVIVRIGNSIDSIRIYNTPDTVYLKSTDTLIKIFAKPKNNRSTIMINEEKGTEKIFNLMTDNDSIKIKVISEDGSNIKEYKVYFKRMKSSEAKIKELRLFPPDGILFPVFNSDVKEYEFTIGDNIDTVIVDVTLLGKGASVSINGISPPAKFYIEPGSIKKPINIVVLAEDGVTKEIYKIGVTRRKSDDALLGGIEFDCETKIVPSFNSENFSYEVKVSSKVDSIRIKPICKNSRAIVTVDGNTTQNGSYSLPIKIDKGKSSLPIRIIVTSESKNVSKEYKLFFNKAYNIKVVSCCNRDAGWVEPTENFDVFEEDSFYIAAYPSEGYHFVKWRIESGEVEIDTFLPKTGGILKRGDSQIRAIFDINKYVVKKELSIYGKSILVSRDTVEHGGKVQIIAIPEKGYLFDKWERVEGSYNIIDSTNDTTTLTDIKSDIVIRGKFKEYKNIKRFGGVGIDVANKVKATLDGGFVVVGYTDSKGNGKKDVYVLKFNSNLELVWEKTYGGKGEDIGNSIIPIEDGGFLVVGEIENDSTGKDVYVLRLKSDGDTLWTKTFDYKAKLNIGYSVIVTKSGDFVIVGTLLDSYYKPYVLRINENGGKKWEKIYYPYFTEGSSVMGIHVYEIEEDNFLMWVEDRTSSFHFFGVDLFRISSEGELIDTNYGGFPFRSGEIISIDKEKNFIVVGTRNVSNNIFYMVIIKQNKEGDTLWTKSYGKERNSYGFSICPIKEEGFIVVGKGDVKIDNYFNGDVFIVRCDNNGDSLWSKNIGGTGEDVGYGITSLSDGNFIIVGSTTSFGAKDTDILLIKIDSEGNLE